MWPHPPDRDAGRPPSVVGEAVHQSLVPGLCADHGSKFVPLLVEAQEQPAGAKRVPR